jgi:putative Mg2+ transporter-C (MgtC) family protein
MPSDLELLGRLLLAALLGGAIGAERELNDQAAGLRTHMLLTIGACLFTLVSAYGFGAPTDPSRLAAQVVTGIGFLGGGAIVRHGLTVKGLTTAASIWATASVGVAVGAGQYVLAVGGAVLVSVTLLGLRRVDALLQRWGVSREELVLATRPGSTSSRSWRRCGASGWRCGAWSARRVTARTGSCWWSSCGRATGPSGCSTCFAAWTACARSNGSASQPSPRRSGSSAGSQVRPTRNGSKRP